MPPIRRSNRVPKPKVYWEPPPPTRRRQPPVITIYTDPSEDLSPEDLAMQPPEDLDMQSPEDLDSQPEDLDSQPEDLDSEPEDPDLEPTEDPDTEPLEDQPYQPQFLPTNRAGRPQNLPENIEPVKLFQLFFTVKEIKNIVKQTNQQAAHIEFKFPWTPITVTEAYHYLGCLVYIGVQPLRELEDHWSQLNSLVKSCLSQRRFKQIRRAFTIRDPNTSPQTPEDP